ncbi:hypothetical protein [Flavobacterium selenitireducens]|uniref:hypothetical protein n=1 Tax=Flavobacterium selenitireducens TaxID=2722704 RepID=UPI00168BE1C4|nr:hypothetical protein [Flavobacterium selenitireducens]MBD3583020.1 hypothetical protein [Flavobacterium selenitireducens]
MKNSILMLGAIALATVASCEKKTETTIESRDTTVVVTPPPPAVETPQDTSGTSVEVGKEGVNVDGDNTDVEVKDGKTKVEVK